MLKFGAGKARLFLLTTISAGALALSANLASAQTDGATSPAPAANDDSVVVVTGFRASLQKSLSQKRRSDTMIDVITGEDIGKFPDSNLAEALQRLPGVSIDRDNGEGRSITVRGLGGDFTRTQLNGLEAQSTAGPENGQSTANRTRGFDFNTFASDLFSALKVEKTAQAATDEGSLGATVNLMTPRPLDLKKEKRALSLQGAYYTQGEKVSPRVAALYSNSWFGNKFGVLVGGAYQERESIVNSYDRNVGQFEYIYRGSQHLGKTYNGTGNAGTPVCNTAATTAPNTSPLNCVWGFAQPTTVTPASMGVNPGSYTFGSDPTAYAAVQSNLNNLFATFPGLRYQEYKYKRLGLNGTMQWKPTENTTFTFDTLYATYEQDNQNYTINPISSNRNGTNARAEILTGANGLRAVNTANGWLDRRAVYGTACTASATLDCTGTAGTATTPVFSTTQYWNGSAYVAVPTTLGVNTFSTNPYNLDTYDYYNNPNSVGYISDPNGIAFYNQLIGRPATQLKTAHVNSAGQVDYSVMDRVDWRNSNENSVNNTTFRQNDLIINHRFDDNTKIEIIWGKASSGFSMWGYLMEFNAMDKNGYTFDERAGGDMPSINPGFDVANSANWDIVKGLTNIRIYDRRVSNSYETKKFDLTHRINEQFELAYGLTVKEYGFMASSRQHVSTREAIQPTIAELRKYGVATGKTEYANLTIKDLGQMVQYGDGLDLPAGTPTAWFAPNREAFVKYLGIDCDCINAFGDYRLSSINGDTQFVTDKDTSQYLQLNFDLTAFGRPLRGNTGVRVAKTEVNSRSAGTTGLANGVVFTGSNTYTDTLPSINLAYELTDKLLVRFGAAKVMARPSLGLLTAGITSLPTALPSSGDPVLTLGNPKLKPFRATNFDLSAEWYFARDAILAVAFFHKDMETNPQVLRSEDSIQNALSPETVTALLGPSCGTGVFNAVMCNYASAGGLFYINQARDAPGGFIDGVEIQYQQDFSFLPKPFDGLGVQANVTFINSKLAYLISGGSSGNPVYSNGPFLNASPTSANVTVYYEKGKWEGRLTASARKAYDTTYPIYNGTCDPGLTTNATGFCNSPANYDTVGSLDTLDLGAKITYSMSKHIRFDLQGQNLTGSTDRRYAYAQQVARTYKSTGSIITMGVRYSY